MDPDRRNECSTAEAKAAYCQMDARDPSNVVEASLDVRGVGSPTPRKDKLFIVLPGRHGLHVGALSKMCAVHYVHGRSLFSSSYSLSLSRSRSCALSLVALLLLCLWPSQHLGYCRSHPLDLLLISFCYVLLFYILLCRAV